MRTAVCMLLLFWNQFVSAASVDLVRVLKSEHKLQLVSAGKVVNEFHVALGGNPKGHKKQEGDERTPEGQYVLDYKNENSSFYRAIHISYPNTKDTELAMSMGVSPGGQVMIHGQKNGFGWLSSVMQRFNWTDGCVALSNQDMDIVWQKVRTGTPIELFP